MAGTGKTIHLVRHAQGSHNLESVIRVSRRSLYMLLFRWQRYFTVFFLFRGLRILKNNLMSRRPSEGDNLDASLTATGWKQTEEFRAYLKTSGLAAQIQLVVVSPMRRTLQTTAGGFGAEDFEEENGILMLDGVGRAPHPATSLPATGPPIVASELCREVLSPSESNRRRPVKVARKEFPGVDFSQVESDSDVLWNGKYEPEEAVKERSNAFLDWLLARPEKEIAVVAHGVFLCALVDRFCERFGGKATRSSFKNCELRTMKNDQIVDMFVPESG